MVAVDSLVFRKAYYSSYEISSNTKNLRYPSDIQLTCVPSSPKSPFGHTARPIKVGIRTSSLGRAITDLHVIMTIIHKTAVPEKNVSSLPLLPESLAKDHHEREPQYLNLRQDKVFMGLQLGMGTDVFEYILMILCVEIDIVVGSLSHMR